MTEISRRYMNSRWCVRCGRCGPTPYLKHKVQKLVTNSNQRILDIGCGNGRNTKYIQDYVTPKVVALDMCNDFGTKCILGQDKFPVKTKSMDIVLANYVLMFLNDKELRFTIDEIDRVSKVGCRLMVELYPAKDSRTKTKDEMLTFQLTLNVVSGPYWEMEHYVQGKFIARKVE